ncbi:MAG: hypothetical protein M3306_11710 [Actinomycetota bacterium]|nr:hypothetical protein [Actinomycetota bacterium]
MYVHVNRLGDVSFEDLDVFTSLAVREELGDRDALALALSVAGAGELTGPSQVALDPDWLRSRGHPNARWSLEFDAMVRYASGRDWIRADGFLLAHIERV